MILSLFFIVFPMKKVLNNIIVDIIKGSPCALFPSCVSPMGLNYLGCYMVVYFVKKHITKLKRTLAHGFIDNA